MKPEQSIARPHWGWWLLVGVTLAWLMGMTLRPDSSPNTINLVPLAEHSRAAACLVNPACRAWHSAFWFLFIDVLGNIAVFVPLGFGLAGLLHRGWSWQTLWRAATLGLLVSLVIELIQLAIPTRATDVDDLIFNTAGTILGAAIFLLARRLYRYAGLPVPANLRRDSELLGEPDP